MKLFVITLVIFSALGMSVSFSAEGPELIRKSIDKKPPHGDDGSGGSGDGK